MPRRGALLVACAAMCWSSGGLIARLVTTSPWTTSLWRSVFASCFPTLVLRMVRGRSVVAQWRDGGRPVLAVAVCMAVSSTCFILSLAHTSVANTLILMSTGPYVAGLLGWMLLGERVALRTWLTMGVALAGAVVMVSNSYRRGAMTGDLLAIVMASSFAIATVLVRRHPEIQMAPAAALATALTALVALPLADPFATTPRDLVLLAFFGVGQFGAGFLLFVAGARLIPAAESSLIVMLETVLGPLWGLARIERAAWNGVAGGRRPHPGRAPGEHPHRLPDATNGQVPQVGDRSSAADPAPLTCSARWYAAPLAQGSLTATGMPEAGRRARTGAKSTGG